jgi:hypothetical protein
MLSLSPSVRVWLCAEVADVVILHALVLPDFENQESIGPRGRRSDKDQIWRGKRAISSRVAQQSDSPHDIRLNVPDPSDVGRLGRCTAPPVPGESIECCQVRLATGDVTDAPLSIQLNLSRFAN